MGDAIVISVDCLSKPLQNLLEDTEIQERFCDGCRYDEWTRGEFDYITGFGEPPRDLCPVEHDFTDPGCAQRCKYASLILALQDIDEILEG